MIRVWFIAVTMGIALGALTVVDPVGRLAGAAVEAQ